MSSAEFQPIQGMSDLVPPEVTRWQSVEAQARHILDLYGFDEIRTPLLERTEVFQRSLGDTTDVVQKEMYSFEDRGGRSLTLRPEGTAGVMRHLAGRGPDGQEARVFYWGPMFRSERPQAGRKRQFHQLGAEALGPPNPAADAEMLALQLQLLTGFGLTGCQVQLNTRGTFEDRGSVEQGLRDALQPHVSELGADDQRRFKENVLRVLDSKEPATRSVVASLPPVTSFMSPDSRRYLEEVERMLNLLSIDVQVNPRLVRGLDYYVHTVWEITHDALGAQDALSGGGRYQIELGGKTMEGVGFAMGLERVLTVLLQEEGEAAKPIPGNLVWIVSLGESAFRENLILVQTLRLRGIRCRLDLSGRSMKAQMRAANRAGATTVIIRGEQEMEKGTFQVKSMEDGKQEELAMAELLQRLAPLHVHNA